MEKRLKTSKDDFEIIISLGNDGFTIRNGCSGNEVTVEKGLIACGYMQTALACIFYHKGAPIDEIKNLLLDLYLGAMSDFGDKVREEK